MADDGGVGIGFHRITDGEFLGQSCPQESPFFIEDCGIVNKQRRSMDPHNFAHWHVSSMQLAVDEAKMLIDQCAYLNHIRWVLAAFRPILEWEAACLLDL